jgi:hypothetical protein
MHPTLLNSCARAATAAEARFRIDAPARAPRAARVVALDAGAATVVRRLAERSWQGARFLVHDPARNAQEAASLADIVLTTTDGGTARLSTELADADFVMMIATNDDGTAVASAIGNACTLRGIVTAGLIFGEDEAVRAAVSALRPYARVLLVSRDEEDAAEVLSAVGG